MPNDANIDPRFFDSLSDKLEVLGRNIEILNETVMRMSNTGSRGGRGDSFMYNMSSYDYKNDIFRGKELSLTSREASLNERNSFKEYIKGLKEVLDNNIEKERDLVRKRQKLLDEAPNKRARIAIDRLELTERKAKAEQEKSRWEELKNIATTPQEIAEATRNILNLDDEISSLTKSIDDCQKSFDRIDEEISETEKSIEDAKKEQRRIKGQIKYDDVSNESKLTYEEYAKQQEAIRRGQAAASAWKEMRASEKAYYGGDNERGFKNFRETKEAQHEFNERYKERQDLQGMIQNSGVENTAFGRITQKAITRNQRFDNMQNFGRKMTKEGGAERLAKQLFGTGKAAGFATKAFSGLGGIIGKFGNLLGKPLIGGILMFIDVLKAAGKAVMDGMNEYAKVTAMMIELQTQQERVQYEQAKQNLILETQTAIEEVSLAGDLAVKHTEMMSQNFLEGLSIQNEAFVRSMEIGTGAMTMGVAQTAYAAAEASIDQAAKTRKYEIHQGQREASFGLYRNQRKLEAESNFANIAAGLTEADVQAMIGMSDAAFKFKQDMMQEVHGGISNVASGNITGSSVVAATSGLRDETANTTTGVRGQGNTNQITGEATSVQGTSQMTGNQLIEAGDVHGYGKVVASGVTGAGFDGFRRENDANYNNMKQNIELGVDAMKTKTEQYYNFAKTQMQYQTQLQQQVVDVTAQGQESVVDAATSVEKNWLKTTQAIEEWVRKFDEKMNDVALNVGMWTKESMAAFKQAHLDTVKALAQKYGKSEEEIAAYQNAYSEESGRNKLLSREDLDKAVSLGVLVGDDSTVAKYVSEMEAFNQSAGDTAEVIKNEMNNINKLGLNARKYMKDVANNLKLANRYNFKEGTKSLREMVKWAEQTKFRMESLGGMIDKVREGGIEGVITQSAGFQVLGGMAAINSDPLGMLFDAWADAPGYAKRMQDMTKGFGTFDKKIGETTFNMPENMFIEQIAKLQGRTGEELREEIRRRNQTEAIRASMSLQQKKEFSDEQLQYLSNAATYDKERQVWTVNLLDKNKGEFVKKDISELNAEDLKNYATVSDNYEEKMTTMVEELVSLVARERGEQWLQLADQAAKDYKNTMDNLNQRLTNIHNDYLNNSENIYKEVKTKQEEITKNVKSFLEQFATNIDNDTSAINKEVIEIRNKTGDITSALQYVSESINAAQAAINKEWQEKLNDYKGEVKDVKVSGQKTVANNTSSTVNGVVNNAQMSTAKRAWLNYFNESGHGRKATVERINEFEKKKNEKGGALSQKTLENYRDIITEGWDDLADSMEAVGLIKSDNRNDITVDDIQKMINEMPSQAELDAWEKKRNGGGKKISPEMEVARARNMGDGYVRSSGEPMTISAPDANLTKINDGFIQTSGRDNILAYQPGGKIDDSFVGAIEASNNTYQMVREILEPIKDLSLNSSHTGGTQTIKHEFSGSIKIESNGQTMDFLGMLQSNPILMREFVSTITKEFRTTENGGKSSTFDRNRNYVG